MRERSSTVIHFVRHGEVDNPQNLRYGRLPGFHLSRSGRLQIEQSAHVVTRFGVSGIYTSPLERTQQTATLLAMAHPQVPIRIDDRLNEIWTGSQFEGKSRNLRFEYPTVETQDGETKIEVVDRMLNFCRFALRNHPGEHILAISHGDPIGLLYHEVMFGDHSHPNRYAYPGYGSVWSFYWFEHQCHSVVATLITEDGTIRS